MVFLNYIKNFIKLLFKNDCIYALALASISLITFYFYFYSYICNYRGGGGRYYYYYYHHYCYYYQYYHHYHRCHPCIGYTSYTNYGKYRNEYFSICEFCDYCDSHHHYFTTPNYCAEDECGEIPDRVKYNYNYGDGDAADACYKTVLVTMMVTIAALLSIPLVPALFTEIKP